MRTSLAIIFLILFSLASSVIAAPRDEFYQARVAVGGQSADEREQAIRQALEQLLVRMTGRPDIASEAAVEGVLRNSSRYVQQFRYDSGVEGLRLSVSFDGPGLRRALAEREVALWRNERPPVLLWLALDGGGERMLLGANERSALREPISHRARELGVPMLFPLLDLEDMNQVSFADVWGGFGDNLRRASQRYGAPVIVAARVYRDRNGQWVGRWSLLDQRSDGVWQTADRELERALQAGMDELTQRLVPRYAVVPSLRASSDQLRLQVSDVRNLDEYLRVSRYLSEISGVRGTQVERLNADRATFVVALEATPERFLRTLSNDGRLVAVSADEAVADDLHMFRLRR